jgi:hypothetical protein
MVFMKKRATTSRYRVIGEGGLEKNLGARGWIERRIGKPNAWSSTSGEFVKKDGKYYLETKNASYPIIGGDYVTIIHKNINKLAKDRKYRFRPTKKMEEIEVQTINSRELERYWGKPVTLYYHAGSGKYSNHEDILEFNDDGDFCFDFGKGIGKLLIKNGDGLKIGDKECIFDESD